MGTNTTRYVAAALVGVLCVSVSAQDPERWEEPGVLISQPYPVLAGIDRLLVTIATPGAEAKKGDPVFEKLQAAVKERLGEAGLIVDFEIAGALLDVPELRIDVDILRLDHPEQVVFRIQTSLARAVSLSYRPSLHLKPDVWKTASVMQAVPIRRMPAEVTEVVLGQVDTFIHCWDAADSDPTLPATGASPLGASRGSVIERSNEPVIQVAPAEITYVASKRSKVFHRADCPSGKAIAPKNLVIYRTRQQALADGKRPCRRCNP